MKLLVILAAVCALALGGVHREDQEPSWMVWPDDHGVPQVAVLRGPKPEVHLDPFLDVLFYVHTRTNPDVPVQMWVGDLNNAPYDPTKPVKLIIHGYNSNSQIEWVTAMKDAYLRAQDVNVILIEWGEQASGPLYNLIKDKTVQVGQYVGTFLNYLVLQGADSSMFHCSGHSLGGHACGIAGKSMSTPLGRVTGLEPALPLYDYEVTDERLTPEDAIFVDVIHTCGGWLGFDLPLGIADFYPNEGVSSQPGCGLDLTGACSHSRSHDLFTESIESSGFVSHQCGSWAEYDSGLCSSTPISSMGEPANPNLTGLFYLRTRRDPPYAMG